MKVNNKDRLRTLIKNVINIALDNSALISDAVMTQIDCHDDSTEESCIYFKPGSPTCTPCENKIYLLKVELKDRNERISNLVKTQTESMNKLIKEHEETVQRISGDLSEAKDTITRFESHVKSLSGRLERKSQSTPVKVIYYFSE